MNLSEWIVRTVLRKQLEDAALKVGLTQEVMEKSMKVIQRVEKDVGLSYEELDALDNGIMALALVKSGASDGKPRL